ncbi:MAG: hypothetical protein ACLFP4_04260 [Spirochaetales bacterium]
MIWLILSVISSVSVALLLKYADVRRVDPFPLFSINYAMATSLGLLGGGADVAREPAAAIALAILIGLFYVLGFLVFRRSIVTNGTGVAASVSRLSVILPILLSVIAFGEVLGAVGTIGVVVGIAVLPFAGGGERTDYTRNLGDQRSISSILLPLALFFVFGVNDSALKVRVELLSSSSEGGFFAILFGTALLISLFLALIRRQRYRRETLLLGAPLGAVNFGTALFLSRALEQLPGSLVFTLNSVGVILGATIAGGLLFNERLTPRTYLFLAGSVISIILLGGVAARQ